MVGTPGLADLNDRAKLIFRTIVDGYLADGEPVASRTISRTPNIDLSPATIRNVMADLEDAGLLTAPHTSAGRIPTELGLKFFVDGMMQINRLEAGDRAAIKAGIQDGARAEGMPRGDDILSDATKALSGLSSLASVVFVPNKDVTVKHIEFVPLSPGQAMVILVGDDGRVENRLIDLPPGTPPASLVQAGNYLNHRMAGRSLDDLGVELMHQREQEVSELDQVAARLVEAGLASWTKTQGDADIDAGSLIIAGQSKLLDTVSHQQDLERIRQLFDALEQKREVMQLMDLARAGRSVSVFIGAENKYFSLSGSSLIAAPYMDGTDRVLGVIGVIGPTRLNYAKIIPMVDYTAHMVSELIKSR